MTIAGFKKTMLTKGTKVYSVRKYNNKHGEGYTITYAHLLGNNAISTEKTDNFHELTLSEISERMQ